MRIIDMRPERTPWKDGQTGKASTWSFKDSTRPIGAHIRQVYHYTTLMGEYVGFEYEFDKTRGEITWVWSFEPISIGIGSVSDQGGMNQLMSMHYRPGIGMMQDFGYYYSRDKRGGGPRIENTHTNEEVV